MGKMSRRKGANAEREVRDIFREYGFDVERDGHNNFDGDLKHDIEGFHFEVKRCEQIEMGRWLKQARADAVKTGAADAVIWRRSGEPWSINVPLRVFLSLLRLVAR